MRVTNEMMKGSIEGLGLKVGLELRLQQYNGYYHLFYDGNRIFSGSKRELYDFCTGASSLLRFKQ